MYSSLAVVSCLLACFRNARSILILFFSPCCSISFTRTSHFCSYYSYFKEVALQSDVLMDTVAPNFLFLKFCLSDSKKCSSANEGWLSGALQKSSVEPCLPPLLPSELQLLRRAYKQ